MVSGVLGGSRKDLTFMILEHASVRLADDSLLDVWRRAGLCEKGDFEKHAAGKIYAL